VFISWFNRGFRCGSDLENGSKTKFGTDHAVDQAGFPITQRKMIDDNPPAPIVPLISVLIQGGAV